ncbi:hypothetical protein DYI23_09935 [Roseibium polysiphoniae]|uniref:Uncharacterized protein n=1 Tax=Roseibium polysiphoniae TaxID=2571221 RepID=A0A944CDH1_9HYPH|nr:hypothetical protein [Roseibium polysiphoniae]
MPSFLELTQRIVLAVDIVSNRTAQAKAVSQIFSSPAKFMSAIELIRRQQVGLWPADHSLVA